MVRGSSKSPERRSCCCLQTADKMPPKDKGFDAKAMFTKLKSTLTGEEPEPEVSIASRCVA